MKKQSVGWSQGHGARGTTGRLKVSRFSCQAALGGLSPGWAWAEPLHPLGASLRREHPQIP